MSENISNLTKELEQSKTREHLLSDELRILQVFKSFHISLLCINFLGFEIPGKNAFDDFMIYLNIISGQTFQQDHVKKLISNVNEEFNLNKHM